MNSDLANLEFWLNRYQTLSTGLVAILFAWLTIRAMHRQSAKAAEVQTRFETEASKRVREILTKRSEIINEFWKALDWLRDQEAADEELAASINATWWETSEERIELDRLQIIKSSLLPRDRIEIENVISALSHLYDYMDAEMSRRESKNFSYRSKLEKQTVKLTFLANALEQFDERIGVIFIGRQAPLVNRGRTPERIASSFDFHKKEWANRKGPKQNP
ncbi:hypothetical protein [Mesorhizobium sp. BE184]|uniref:hypothetical protein n=1 Tax=Mesorhizobium sp. BE184 TaxID=2817714 RepID=UPI00285D072F|nr:hypothetical protein [Mesorhizobium sp. BE184]MDR7031956.1 hypothetical protein [Mesorhizobium sp. BE184]